MFQYKDKEKFFDDKKNNLNKLKNSNVQKVILLYPWKFDWSFEIDFDKYEKYNNRLLKTWVWIFPINISDSKQFDQYFIDIVVKILNDNR